MHLQKFYQVVAKDISTASASRVDKSVQIVDVNVRKIIEFATADAITAQNIPVKINKYVFGLYLKPPIGPSPPDY